MKILLIRTFFMALLIQQVSCGYDGNGSQGSTWTWLYQKIFSDSELSTQAVEKAVTFSMEDVDDFTQLVFSWNAFRPPQGFYSFWVQSRDSKTHQWTSWHKMMEWGATVQRSFGSLTKSRSRYEHVRLELGNHSADAFRIKAVAQQGASLNQLKAIFVALSDFRKFKSQEVTDGLTLPSLLVANVPKKSQLMTAHPRNTSICSPTSCSMLVEYLLGQEIDPCDFAEKSLDTGLNAYGSWPFNMAHAFERCNGQVLFATARMNSFEGLYQRLAQGIPVVVSVRGFLAGAPKVYHKGHLLMVVGFDAEHQHVLCHDPAFATDEETVTKYDLKSFLAAWERSHRLAYLASPLQ